MKCLVGAPALGFRGGSEPTVGDQESPFDKVEKSKVTRIAGRFKNWKEKSWSIFSEKAVRRNRRWLGSFNELVVLEVRGPGVLY